MNAQQLAIAARVIVIALPATETLGVALPSVSNTLSMLLALIAVSSAKLWLM